MKKKIQSIVLITFTLLIVFQPTLSRALDKMAHGWSYQKENTSEAIQEAVQMLKKDIGKEKPAFIYMAATSIKYDIPAMAKELSTAFPDVPIWGSTSALGIIMNNEHDYMKGNVVGLLALCSSNFKCIVEGASIEKYNNSYTETARALIEKIKKEQGEKSPRMVLFSSSPGPHEEEVMNELKKAFGKKLKIFGGSNGTEAPNPRFSIANTEAYEKGIALLLVYSTKKIGHCYQMGFKAKDIRGRATRVDGRWLHEIDGKPALEVYNDWTDGYFTEAIKEGKNIRGEGQMKNPLAIIKKNAKGEEFLISLSAKGYNKENGAIEFFANIELGDTLTLLKGDNDSLINRAFLAVTKAKKMVRGQMLGGMGFYCSGARLLLEKQNRTQELGPKLRQAFKNKPFILTFNNGEHGCIPDSESFHGNLMLDVIVFEE